MVLMSLIEVDKHWLEQVIIHWDEGLSLETSAQKLSTMANLHHQLIDV